MEDLKYIRLILRSKIFFSEFKRDTAVACPTNKKL